MRREETTPASEELHYLDEDDENYSDNDTEDDDDYSDDYIDGSGAIGVFSTVRPKGR